MPRRKVYITVCSVCVDQKVNNDLKAVKGSIISMDIIYEAQTQKEKKEMLFRTQKDYTKWPMENTYLSLCY